jgi:hypothetical protein
MLSSTAATNWIYIGVILFSAFIIVAGIAILKDTLRERKSDVLAIYGNILVVVIGAIALLFSLFHFILALH